MRTINRTIVSALLISQDNKLFMGKKDPKGGGVYSDCWHIPGGGIETGEDQIAALIREISEETGIDISHLPITLVSNDGTGESEKTLQETGETVLVKMQFNVYRVNLSEPAESIPVQLSDDLVEYHWFDSTKLDQVKLTPPSVELFKKLGYIA